MQKHLAKIVKLFLIGTWSLLLGYFILDVVAVHGAIGVLFPTAEPNICNLVGTIDASRRVLAPDNSRIALLERTHFFDFNYALYILDQGHCDATPADVDKALWLSKDYDPTTLVNRHEEVEWSTDSSVIAITIDGQYAFAYDFNTGRRLETPEQIRELLESRNP